MKSPTCSGQGLASVDASETPSAVATSLNDSETTKLIFMGAPAVAGVVVTREACHGAGRPPNDEAAAAASTFPKRA
jgi:hypothetical protein